MYKVFLALISPFVMGAFALSMFSFFAFIYGVFNHSIPDDPGDTGFIFLFMWFILLPTIICVSLLKVAIRRKTPST